MPFTKKPRNSDDKKPRKDFKKGGYSDHKKPFSSGKKERSGDSAHKGQKGSRSEPTKNGFKRPNPFGEKVTTELKKEYKEKQQKKEAVDDASTQMKQLIDSHFKSHKKWTASEVQQLLTLSKGNMYNLSLRPDSSRVVQTVLKYGDKEQRKEVLEELDDKIITLTKDTYGHFLVKKMFKYLAPNFTKIFIEKISTMLGDLLNHKSSVDVLLTLCDFIPKGKQHELVETMYGPKYQYLKQQNPQLKTVKEIVDTSEVMKNVISKEMGETVMKMLNKEKFEYTPFVAQMFYDYSTVVEGTEAIEFAQTLAESISLFVKHPEGPKLLRFVIMNCSSKYRKTLVKEFEEQIQDLLCDKFGHICLLYFIRHVDDKALLKKFIMSKINTLMVGLVYDKNAIQVIEFILDPLNTRFLPPTIIDPLKDKGTFSIKDDDIRFKDLQSEIKDKVIEICKSEHDGLIKYKPTRKFLSLVKERFPEDTEFITAEDLLPKRDENKEQTPEETEKKKHDEEKKELAKPESDSVKKGEEEDDINEIRAAVAHQKSEKKAEEKAKKEKNDKKKKGYKGL
ncbi:hypothetical protein EIN_023530 [Entamoeba invadens IP1]|uniref:hypothetical protein n=1 Tax=Entamoeba invadens IP1 TaxID=370355 RepID=UPI0002C3E4E8|nr:hypothetical protein EIN_023530 [Entamoeba invadens IP1]ELP90664.1 hypothetical protein EIN_023530 [Entamoeba invadens IP1]|eukprot:XP_004257435.1 hypothetical protein EIN_023530 [Entamoeba invadens IP1]